ncbi:efflux RND transporter periplasmic adaptor subunit [Neptunomonas sp.]|uniref:efflux RND transporter periplasmic adaptor subunit n=1 Tax=Neptunomonas sp. TaxID=1971898 RepID=UPI0035652100
MSRKKSIISTVLLIIGVSAGAVFLLPPQSLPPFLGPLIGQLIGPSAHAAPEQAAYTRDEAEKNAPEQTSAQREQVSDNSQVGRQSKIQANKLLVTVVDTRTQTEQPLVSGYGEVAARWTTELTAEVSGRVDHVSDKLLAGSSFKKGDVLARINSVDYESDLATAKADVATAKVIYLEQQLETQQAKKRWELSGLSGTPSDLTLQTPQLAQALASLKSAKASLTKAEKNLARTHIIAPFNGRVSSRNINPGGYVSSGTSIAEVFATDVVEINIALNDQQFALLGSETEAINTPVTLVDTADNNAQWTAKLARFQYHIDNTERTRNLVLEVSSDHAAEDLMPGTFVKASIPGKPLDDQVKLPASALSRDGYIWHVEDGLLQRFKADITYRKDDYLVVKGQDVNSNLQVVRYPQSAFLPGQAVNVEAVANKAVAPDDHQITSSKGTSVSAGAGA